MLLGRSDDLVTLESAECLLTKDQYKSLSHSQIFYMRRSSLNEIALVVFVTERAVHPSKPPGCTVWR